MIRNTVLLIAFLLISGINAFAQNHPIISFFDGSTFNNQILLSWNIIGGSNCNGIGIFHSTDDENYEEIGFIPGICGAIIDAEPYKFIHEDPAPNQINYYKLALGTQGFTTALSVNFYVTNQSGFSFYPNPTTENVYLFVNEVYKESKIQVFDDSGRLIYDENVNSGVLLEFLPASLSAGNYIIRLTDGNTVIGSERLIKL